MKNSKRTLVNEAIGHSVWISIALIMILSISMSACTKTGCPGMITSTKTLNTEINQ